jgi:hypothetical protein
VVCEVGSPTEANGAFWSPLASWRQPAVFPSDVGMRS